LPEAEVVADGTIVITLLRAVGWLARFDLRRRPIPAGPAMAVEGAQMIGRFAARLALLAGCDPAAAADAECSLRGVIGGPAPLLSADTALLSLAPSSLILSAVKPAESGDGIVVRVLNPSADAVRAILALGFRVTRVAAVRLDETPSGDALVATPRAVEFDIPPRALRSLLIVPAQS
jgi:alpha-mannosidase/mannosylglycerate hydrolase